MDLVQTTIDKLYKDHFGKMVVVVLFSFRDLDWQQAEDIVQDTFSSALNDWRVNGLPLNPAGWVYKAAKNKTINSLKKEKRITELSGNENIVTIESRFTESILDDQNLRLLFACAHPDLAPKVQVAITLKYVANLRVEAIAKVLGMTIDGVDKLLLRARQKIRDEKILFEEVQQQASWIRSLFQRDRSWFSRSINSPSGPNREPKRAILKSINAWRAAVS